jgi:hypothetical protein
MHMGTGIALVLAAIKFFCEEAEAIRVEDAAPVRARITTKARTMFFMGFTPKKFELELFIARCIRDFVD